MRGRAARNVRDELGFPSVLEFSNGKWHRALPRMAEGGANRLASRRRTRPVALSYSDCPVPSNVHTVKQAEGVHVFLGLTIPSHTSKRNKEALGASDRSSHSLPFSPSSSASTPARGRPHPLNL